jgi:hypothetical protein
MNVRAPQEQEEELTPKGAKRRKNVRGTRSLKKPKAQRFYR